MTQEIKLSTDQMRLMSLFQNITKATAILKYLPCMFLIMISQVVFYTIGINI